MRLLVTGGLGFIGSNFILKLLENPDIEITNVDEWVHVLEEAEYSGDYTFISADTLNLTEEKDNI